MRSQENSTDLSTHFSDIQAASRKLRSIIFRSLFRKVWRLIQVSDAPRICPRQGHAATADGDTRAPSPSNGQHERQIFASRSFLTEWSVRRVRTDG
jgi:hypothetical protein